MKIMNKFKIMPVEIRKKSTRAIKQFDLDLIIPENLEDYIMEEESEEHDTYSDVAWKIDKWIISAVFYDEDTLDLSVTLHTKEAGKIIEYDETLGTYYRIEK